MIIPAVMLGTLAIRTLAKPISARFKKGAGLHPKFRDFIIGNCSGCSKTLLRSMNNNHYAMILELGKPSSFDTNAKTDLWTIHPLNEERAVEAAADLLGEFFVFTVAGVALIYEVQRGARSEARKEEMRRQEMEVTYSSSSISVSTVERILYMIVESNRSRH
ncbi:hypothetical protein RJ639_039836 [Escallonia herrerae]|uniref:Uncharacterized protein n=1 Tax=Escallonia herrerae TaxID=1293975 RepID=A0AA89B896_9ASTE|nr:hypothetical protein RJ639_039836 [Escallonia herrerae]